MNLYNFILDRDKLLLPIKARNFIWFLRVFACVSCCGPKNVLFKKDSGMARCWPSLERTCRLDAFQNCIRGGRCPEGGREGPEPGSASVRGLLVPWHSGQLCAQAPCKPVLFLPPPDPPDHRRGRWHAAAGAWWEPWCAAPTGAPVCLHRWEEAGVTESSLVLGAVFRFCFCCFGSPFSQPCLPPSLPQTCTITIQRLLQTCI